MIYPVVRPANRGLPETGIWDTVNPELPVQRKGWLGRLLCQHALSTSYGHVDHRGGPGGYADCYKGIVCTQCGKVLQVQRTF